MENIKFSQLNFSNSGKLIDIEKFLRDLDNTEAMALQGGEGLSISNTYNFFIYKLPNSSAAPGDSATLDEEGAGNASNNGDGGAGSYDYGVIDKISR
ncbi:hypothetical protein ACEYW6_28500 [Nostoc sp. UIC 10607]|uniref:hypothetical protein n=1 Tax=Nostoc sp. UIC 10607 TaxID=3045935 RepID=UPI0039A33B7A